MNSINYITGNPDKAKHMGRMLGEEIQAISLRIPEIQSLDLQEVIQHKTQAAYELLQKPLFIDDVSLTIEGMNKLPGPFIKFFMEEIENELICRMVDIFPTRKASSQTIIGYHDGKEMHFFEGEVKGVISEHPAGNKGFGWDSVFIPEGYEEIRAKMSDEEYDRTSPRKIALDKFKKYLDSH